MTHNFAAFFFKCAQNAFPCTGLIVDPYRSVTMRKRLTLRSLRRAAAFVPKCFVFDRSRCPFSRTALQMQDQKSLKLKLLEEIIFHGPVTCTFHKRRKRELNFFLMLTKSTRVRADSLMYFFNAVSPTIKSQ